jgi:hypothetical protein
VLNDFGWCFGEKKKKKSILEMIFIILGFVVVDKVQLCEMRNDKIKAFGGDVINTPGYYVVDMESEIL